jgi:hypothetical protein
MKKTLLFWFALMSLNGIGQNLTLDDLEGKELHNKIRLNYILIHQPTDQVNYQLKPTMGFIGLNYNFPLNNWLYTGAGFHTAITGDQGGLFTLGINLGINKKFTRIYILTRTFILEEVEDIVL